MLKQCLRYSQYDTHQENLRNMRRTMMEQYESLSSNSNGTKYAEHTRACLDKYPKDKKFLTNSSIQTMAVNTLQNNKSLKGKISAMNRSGEYKKLKAAFKVASVWDIKELKIAFLDGTPEQINWIKTVVEKFIAPIVSKLKFTYVTDLSDSHIRVSFALKGQAWSFIGSDCLQIPKTDPTMNLGWIDNDTDFDIEAYKNTGHVVCHEFGHALGMIHEHQNPKNNPIVWNKEVVYEELERTNGWTKDVTDNNMFKKYGDAELCNQAKQSNNQLDIQNFCEGELVNGSEYDPHSIMHYFFPSAWILEGPKELPINTKYSEQDVIWLKKYYGDGNTSGDGSTTTDIFTLPMLKTVGSISFVFFIMFIIYFLMTRNKKSNTLLSDV